MTIRLIWAQDRNRVIGVGNTLPWRVPEDLRRFQSLTTGSAVVMGRKTWDSLPVAFRPLPDRENWVLTRAPGWTGKGARRAASVTDVLTHTAGRDLWVVGGGEVYALFLPWAEECLVTEIDTATVGDAWAPDLGCGWRRDPDHHAARDWQVSEVGGVGYRYSVFVRDQP